MGTVSSMLKAAGLISDAELLTYRRFGSRLQGHPVPIVPGVDVATQCSWGLFIRSLFAESVDSVLPARQGFDGDVPQGGAVWVFAIE